jgi:hypothetical protein
MALTVTVQDPPVFAEFTGQKGFKRAVVVFDSSYPDGGEPITAANVGLGSLENMQITCDQDFAVGGGYVVEWDKTAGTLRVLATGAAAGAILDEEAAATDLSALSCNVLAFGKLL